MTQGSPAKPTGGVLPIPASATQKNAPAPQKKPPKPPVPRLKLLVRRLPPGLTEEEFKHGLGEEWMVGAGKVDWFQYKSGKVSKDPSKPSRPSRAYVHVVASEHIAPLADKVRQTPFLDALNTANDPVLLGPPSLEFAPYAKTAGNRTRKDARQGTIDQDPEFIVFLESLTQPITKPNAPDTAPEGEGKKNGTTVTPLVQYIKDKKANKAKEHAASKSKKSDRETKAEKVQAKKLLQRPDRDSAQSSTTEKREKKSKADKAAKDAVKAANKQAANATKQSGKGATTPNATKEAGAAPSSERKKDRGGNATAASKILQRDLGISSGGGGGRRKGGGGKGANDENDTPRNKESESKKDTPAKSRKGQSAEGNSENTSASNDQTTTGASTPAAAGNSNSNKPPKSAKGKTAAPASPNPTSTQAFLKHANPSQGVTEQLLETAFAPFGTVAKVEIDRKKGFGYVDFAEPSGLQSAVAASPVSVAQSQVVVLERKANPGGEKGRGKGQQQQAPAASGGGSSGNNTNNGGRGGAKDGGSSRGPRSRGRNKGGSKTKEEKGEAKPPRRPPSATDRSQDITARQRSSPLPGPAQDHNNRARNKPPKKSYRSPKRVKQGRVGSTTCTRH